MGEGDPAEKVLELTGGVGSGGKDGVAMCVMRIFGVLAVGVGAVVGAFCVLGLGGDSIGGEAVAGGEIGPGAIVRIPVSRDTWVSSVEGEEDANLGGASRLKTKGIQELAIVDLDPGMLRGWVIRRARLHFHCRSEDPQRRLTVSTLACDWEEGHSTVYRKEPGSASFRWARQDQQRWAYPGSDLTAVICGQGNTTWRFADCTGPDEEGWQSVEVEPAVMAARAAGVSYGFVVVDDVGSEYERAGERFMYRPFPNRFVSSRESGRKLAPYFTVELGDGDHDPPLTVGEIRCEADGADGSGVMARWVTPEDAGPAGTIGFLARWSVGEAFDWEPAREVERHEIPMAGRAGQMVEMRLREVGAEVGSDLSIGVRAVDGAGNVGPVSVGSIRMQKQAFTNPFEADAARADNVEMFRDEGEVARLGDASVFVIDPLDKVGVAAPGAPGTPGAVPLDVVAEKMIPPRTAGYLRANHLWSGAKKLVRLNAGRNEFVAFQVVLAGSSDGLRATLKFEDPASAKVTLYQSRYVRSQKGLLADPLVELQRPVQMIAYQGGAAGVGLVSLYGEVYVPHQAQTGEHRGVLRLERLGESLEIRVELRVWDFTLPDVLSFMPQMNCYGLPGPPVELEYYRLAQVNRTCLNRLPYNWVGRVHDGCVPEQKGDEWDWTRYDRRFGPLLDGSAFADLPRGAVPVEAFYLPIHENWPADVHQGFRGSYWADEAFTEGYRKEFVDECRRFAAHIEARGWTETFFEFFLNNKVFFKRDRWGNCTAPWIFDEPVNTQDFWALRWYGLAFHEGVAGAAGRVKMAFRCDISRPQWQRDLLDGVMDVNVVSAGMRPYLRMVMDRKERWGQIVYEYGSANGVERSNVQPAAWCVDAWTLGADGVVPWQTVGTAAAWEKGDATSLFYPPIRESAGKPVPSARLKAFLRGQQDVEYLTLLGLNLGLPRSVLAQHVRRMLGLKAQFEKVNEQDAGTLHYDELDPIALWRLRVRVGMILNRLKPAPRRKLVELWTPTRDVADLPKVGYVTTEQRDGPGGEH